MSKPRYRWWGFARKMVRDYPLLQEAWQDIHTQKITADISGMPRGGGSGRSLENIALRQLPEDDQKVYDAVSMAIRITKLRPDGEDRMKLITAMYWMPRSVPAKSIAPSLHISDVTAKRWHGDFVRLVGSCYGFKT